MISYTGVCLPRLRTSWCSTNSHLRQTSIITALASGIRCISSASAYLYRSTEVKSLILSASRCVLTAHMPNPSWEREGNRLVGLPVFLFTFVFKCALTYFDYCVSWRSVYFVNLWRALKVAIDPGPWDLEIHAMWQRRHECLLLDTHRVVAPGTERGQAAYNSTSSGTAPFLCVQYDICMCSDWNACAVVHQPL